MHVELHHLSGSRRGQVDRPSTREARVGTGRAAEVRVSGAGILPVHLSLEITETDAYLRAEGPTLLNGEPVREVRLEDGDRLELPAGVELRFRMGEQAPPPGARNPSSVSDNSSHGALFTAVTSLAILLLLLTSAFLVVRAGGPDLALKKELESTRKAQAAALAGQKSLKSLYEEKTLHLRKRVEELEHHAARRTDVDARVSAVHGEVKKAMEEVGAEVESLHDEIQRSIPKPDPNRLLDPADQAAQEVIAKSRNAVCLIEGAYGFGREDKGHWTFLRELSKKVLGAAENSGDKVPLTLDGDGPLFKVEYTGTGFLVDAKGLVVTNRHIAQPWWRNDAADPLLKDGFKPRFLYLRAYFPGRKSFLGFEIDKSVVSQEADVAVLRFAPCKGLPEPLHLAREDDLEVGRRIVLLGFPSGIHALLAKSEDGFASKLLHGKPFDTSRVLEALAERDLVRPLPSQGHVADVLKDKVLYDAPTATGGSGGPVLDLRGRVVAINYGILEAFRGANFGVPVRYARETLAAMGTAPRTR